MIPSFNVSVTLYALKGSTEILRNPAWEVIWVFLYDLYKFCFGTFKHVAVKRVYVFCAGVFVGKELRMREERTKNNTCF